MTEFVENQLKQTFGVCEAFDRGQIFDYVVYDTTGKSTLPISQRTPEWVQVVSQGVVKTMVSEELPLPHCSAITTPCG